MPKITKYSIPREIRKARAERGLSQKELAELIPCNYQEISMYENGKRLPSLERLDLIARALGKEWKLD